MKAYKKIIAVSVFAVLVLTMLTVRCCAAEATVSEASSGLSGTINAVLELCENNPESLLAAIITVAAGGVNVAGGVSNKKTREKLDDDSKNLISTAGVINDNAVKIVENVKTELLGFVSKTETSMDEAVKAICEKTDELINHISENTREIKSMRRELRANSYLQREMFKDARLTRVRKSEIEAGYTALMEEDELNHDIDDKA